MDNATRRQLLEQAKQVGYTGSILDVFQNPQVLNQFAQEQQVQQQTQVQQQPQQQMQVEMPTLPATTPNYRVSQPRQSEAQPLVMSNTEVPIQIRKTGGLKFNDGGPLSKVDPNTNPNQDLTYKDNPEWFDNRAIYSGDDRYDAQIRKLVYEGKGSYNPATRTLTRFTNPNQQYKVDETIKTLSKDKRTWNEQDKKTVAKVKEDATKMTPEKARQYIIDNQKDFVQKSALAAGTLAAPFAVPAVMGALEAPMVIAGSTVPGVTVGSTIGAGFGGYGLTQLPNTYDAVSEAYNNPTTSNITDAAEAVGVNALDFVGLGIGKAALSGTKNAGRFLTTQTPLKNAYKLRSSVLKENPKMFLYRTQPKNFVAGITEEQELKNIITDNLLKGKETPWHIRAKLDKIRYYPEPFRESLNKYHGQWFDKNPERMDFYMRGRLDGDEGNILRLKVPKEEGLSYNLKNFPEAQKASLNYDTEFIVPRNKLNQAESFSTNDWQQLIQEDKAFNTPHWWKGYGSNTPKQLPGSGNVSRSIKQSSNKINQSIIDAYTQREIIDSYKTGGKKCYTCNQSKLQVLYNKRNYKK